MRAIRFLFFTMFLFVFAGCIYATNPAEEKEKTYAPVEASLTHIDQKVAGHFLVKGVPDSFNGEQYRSAVKEVCYSNPTCKSEAEAIFDSYGVQARKIDDMFSVMLCDKEMTSKVMEHFSCNNMSVQVKSWKLDDKAPCEFEKEWVRIKQENCSN